jgi:hypothetical protein
MHAEFPPEFPICRVIGPIGFYEPVDCAMWRMEIHCPNTTDNGIICEDTAGRRFVLPQCPLCACETETDSTPAGIVVRDQQIANQILAHFEFGPQYQDRIATSDILGSLNKVGRADEMRVASTLKAHGATKEHTSAGTRWNGLRWRP